MRLNEFLKPGEGSVYARGNKIARNPDGQYVISGHDQGARTQYFTTEDNQAYVVNIDPVTGHGQDPASTTLSFGNLDSSGTLNYTDLRKLPISQAAKVLNTIISVASAYSSAHGEVPLWTFNTNSKKKARVYKMLSSRIAKKIQGGFRYFKDDDWGDYLFLVHTNTERGKAQMKAYVDFIDEYLDLEENPSDL